MKSIILRLGLALPFLVGMLLSACAAATPVAPEVTTDTAGNGPSIIPASGGVSQSTTEPSPDTVRSGDYYTLPTQPDILPSDIIQQVAWTAIGGPTDCDPEYCITIKDNKIFLSRFQPNQQIRIDIYEYIGDQDYYLIGNFLTEIRVTTDSNGEFELAFNRDRKEIEYVVLNQSGGFLTQWPMNMRDLNDMVKTNDCPGSLKSRVSVGMMVRVTFTDGTPTRIRSKPTRDSSTWIADLPEGTTMKVIDGPQCAGGWVWWQVDAENGYSGWVSEGDQTTWFIEPIP